MLKLNFLKFVLFWVALFVAIESVEAEIVKSLPEMAVESAAKLLLPSGNLEYRTVVGTLILKDLQAKEKASLFYTAYFSKRGTSQERPITFCFNGGPGAASVWLNLGLLGPKRILGDDLAFLTPPYQLIDNLETVLEMTDLVFIDPISTGLSEAAPGQDSKQFYNVEEDVQQMSDFIRLFTSKYQRWDSPKYLAGESYGGMRAAKVAYKLQDDYGYYVNGLILISPALDLQTIVLSGVNDLPYLVALPTYAAAAQYHKKLNNEKGAAQAEEFVVNRYINALFKGNRMGENEQRVIAKELSQFTTLPEEKILRENLRISPGRFMKELLQNEGKILGRFDSRLTGADSKCNPYFCEYDPSLDAVFGAITAAYNQYLVKELRWPEIKEYRALVSLSPWNWGACNSFASAVDELRQLFAQNPTMQIFVATGLYDLATPYFATDYSLAQLNLPLRDQARITYRRYPAGHMMYFNEDIRISLSRELKKFIHNR